MQDLIPVSNLLPAKPIPESLSQPSQAYISPAQPISTQPSPSLPSQAHLRPTKPISVQPSPSQRSQAHLCQAKPISAQPSLSQPSQTYLSPAKPRIFFTRNPTFCPGGVTYCLWHISCAISQNFP